MYEFIMGTLMLFLAYAVSTWLFAFVRRCLWLAHGHKDEPQRSHGMVINRETGIVTTQCKPVCRP